VTGRGAVDLLACAFLTERIHGLAFSVSAGSEGFRALGSLFFNGKGLRVDAPANKTLPLAIDTWLSVLRTDFTAYQYRCTLKSAASAASPLPWDPCLPAILEVLVDGKAVPLKSALERTGHRDVLRAPTALSAYLPEIRSLAKNPSVLLGEDRLASFLDEAGSLLSRLGIQVVLPKELLRELKPRLVLRDTKGAGASLMSYLDLGSLVSYEWAMAVGDQILTIEEFEALVAKKTALVRFRDGFVRLNPPGNRQPVKTGSKSGAGFGGGGSEGPLFRSLGTVHGAESIHRYPFGRETVSTPQGPFREPAAIPTTRLQLGLLSPRGGFGCILADDMGLGKPSRPYRCCCGSRRRGFSVKRAPSWLPPLRSFPTGSGNWPALPIPLGEPLPWHCSVSCVLCQGNPHNLPDRGSGWGKTFTKAFFAPYRRRGPHHEKRHHRHF